MSKHADETDRSLRARVAALTLHSQVDGREITAKARKTFADSFEQKVDPNGVLPEEERKRRASKLKRAHYTELARKSAVSRRAKKAQSTPR